MRHAHADFLRGEFIGLNVKINGRKIKGKIIDETKNLFLIKTQDIIIKVMKRDNKFGFEKNGERILVNGNDIIMKPEERIKIRLK